MRVDERTATRLTTISVSSASAKTSIRGGIVGVFESRRLSDKNRRSTTNAKNVVALFSRQICSHYPLFKAVHILTVAYVCTLSHQLAEQ